MAPRVRALLLACICAACGHDGNETYSVQGFAYGGDIYVVSEYGGDGSIRPAEWSIVAWPEMTLVDSTATAPSPYPPIDTTTGSRIVYLEPAMPLDARWYALRWIGTPIRDQRIAGIPLSDGSVVTRFFAAPMNELREVRVFTDGDDDDVVEVLFSDDVVLGAVDPVDAIVVEQGDRVCAGVERAIAESNFFRAACVGADWAAPVTITVAGIVDAETDEPLPAFSQTHVFGASTEPRVLLVPTRLAPPPVPAALCAGVGCE